MLNTLVLFCQRGSVIQKQLLIRSNAKLHTKTIYSGSEVSTRGTKSEARHPLTRIQLHDQRKKRGEEELTKSKPGSVALASQVSEDRGRGTHGGQ